MRVTFLVHSIDGVGGTIRATLSLAGALAEHGHDVEIAALYRRRTRPRFAVPERVRVVSLIDERRGRSRSSERSRIVPAEETRADQYTADTDRRIAAFLSRCRADVVIGTRPGLNLCLAAFRRADTTAIAAEHLLFDRHRPPLRDALCAAIGSLDAYVTVTEADAEAYRAAVPRFADRVHAIHNAIPPTDLEPARGDSRTIVAAGRIVHSKRYDLLIDAFAKILPSHPAWRLRIYGTGDRTPNLRRMVRAGGLGDSVSLMGGRTPMDAEWVKGSIAAVTSRHESFGLTIVEAMDCGLPVVSTDCRHGPAEIIDHGVDGLLCANEDSGAVAEALSTLMGDDDVRARMAVAARRKARRFHPDAAVAAWEDLFDDLGAEPRRRSLLPRSGRRNRDATRPRPHADCRMTSPDTGAVWLDPGGSLRSAAFVDDDGAVVRPHRVGDRIELGDGGLDALTEGRWRLRIRGAPVPAGRLDTRVLARPPEGTPRTWVVPFSDDGDFALRVWRRSRFAEAVAVDVDTGGVRVTARLWGPWGEGTTRLVAALDGRRIEVEALTHGGAVTAWLPFTDLTPGRWALSVERGDRRARVGRHLDDVAAHKTVRLMPRVELPDRVVVPYYTIGENLAVKVTEAPRP